ncbi:hypothetical protein ICY20_00925 [Pseudomonas sp. P115]|uniref:hypothetical protein n=1 Tax=Pseudomonas pisciculturae TaxID=2730413 RepID=UPI00189211EE|nr:hypothetical protein [Pseudomonas pisciculturae]MBF6026274.1 hypothetical protein [Pseudomonas pisciculturae]
MALPVPGLNIPVTEPFDQAEVSLSTLTGPLVVSIPEDAILFADGTVNVILGLDPENPAWEGAKISAGRWHNDTEEYQQLTNVKIDVPKTALEQFVNKTTQLCYIAIGTSGLTNSSDPISLTINK